MSFEFDGPNAVVYKKIFDNSSGTNVLKSTQTMTSNAVVITNLSFQVFTPTGSTVGLSRVGIVIEGNIKGVTGPDSTFHLETMVSQRNANGI